MRELYFNGIPIRDPVPDMNVSEVYRFSITTYPEIIVATLHFRPDDILAYSPVNRKGYQAT
jgi:PRTRC genetic system protein C